MIADAAGRAVAFALAPGQAHDLPHAVPLLARLPGVPMWVVADRGYSSHAFREHVWNLGARPAIPARRDEAPVACSEPIYNNRNRVERPPCLKTQHWLQKSRLLHRASTPGKTSAFAAHKSGAKVGFGSPAAVPTSF